MGAKKLKDLDTIMTVGILAKNVQTVDIVNGVGWVSESPQRSHG